MFITLGSLTILNETWNVYTIIWEGMRYALVSIHPQQPHTPLHILQIIL